MDSQTEISIFKEQFFELVQNASNILITSHKTPDDDSISSVLSTREVILNKFPDKNIQIIYSSEVGSKWNRFEGIEKVSSDLNLSSKIDEFDLLILVDVSQYNRVGIENDHLKSFDGKTVCIDHHKSPVDSFDLSYINGIKASCAQVIYDIFIEEYEVIPNSLCKTVLLGIMGDTGWLTFIRQDQLENFDIVKRLVKEGNIELQDYKSRIFGYEEKLFLLIKEFMNNVVILEIKGWPKALCSYIEINNLYERGYTDIEISAAAKIFIHSYGTSILEIPWGFVAYPQGNTMKVSMRSRPEGVNVRLLSERMGYGGGHDLASGMAFKEVDGKVLEPKECMDKIFEWMTQNSPSTT